jgi:hypothetical protein
LPAFDGKNAPSTVAAAPDVVEWPEGYEGNGGVTMYEFHEGSIRARIAVTGRSDQYVNFASQQAMKASAWAVLSAAKRPAVKIVDRCTPLTRSSAMTFQWPGGVTVPAPSAQRLAIREPTASQSHPVLRERLQPRRKYEHG